MRTALLLTLLGVGGCSSAAAPVAKRPEPCPPVEAKVALTATARVNASPEGEGRPVQVRLYQLQSDAKLRGAAFEEIWQKDQEVLQTDLKSVTEYTVFPGKTQVVSLKRNPEAHFLALVALFREPKGKDWFLTYELEQPPETPPCAEPGVLSVFLDRMQIQDGEDRGDGSEVDASKTEGEDAPGTARGGQ